MKHRVSNLHPGSQTVARLAGFALAVSLLSGCAVQDLKAPCSREEGQAQPLAFLSVAEPAAEPDFSATDRPDVIASAGLGDCGPLRRINPN